MPCLFLLSTWGGIARLLELRSPSGLPPFQQPQHRDEDALRSTDDLPSNEERLDTRSVAQAALGHISQSGT